MTKREIVIQALQHKETRPIPHQIDLTGQAYERLVEYTGDTGIYGKLGNYLCCPHYCAYATEIPGKPGYFKDDFGVIWNRNGADKDIGIPDFNLIEDLEDYDYQFPVLNEARLRADLEKWMKWKVWKSRPAKT